MDDQVKVELLKFLNNLHIQAHAEFDEWDVGSGKPTYLVNKMQDLTFFIAEVKKDIADKTEKVELK